MPTNTKQPILSEAQKQIVNSDAKFRVVVTGRRFGKTTLSVWEMLSFALYRPNSRIVYVAPTIKQARDIAWGMLKEITRPAWVSEPNETRLELSIKCVDGGVSQIWLRGAENIESLRGLGIHFLVVDEVASMTNWDNIWSEVLRPTLLDTKGQALFIGTPKGFNHFYDLFNVETLDPDFKSFRFTSYDNRTIEGLDIELDKIRAEYERNKRMDEFRQEYMAEFVSVSGQVYKAWDFITHFTQVPYDPYLPVHITMDFGVNDPTALIWIQKQGGEFRIIDYYEASNADVGHFVQVIRGKPYREPELVTGDPAGKARSIVTGTSPIDEYARSGIFIRTKDGVRIPEQIRIAHKYMPSLYIDNKLTRLRDCILNYRYPEKKDTAIDQSNEIPYHDEYSHAMRALEYYFVNIDGTMDQQRIKIPQNNFSRYKIG